MHRRHILCLKIPYNSWLKCEHEKHDVEHNILMEKKEKKNNNNKNGFVTRYNELMSKYNINNLTEGVGNIRRNVPEIRIYNL